MSRADHHGHDVSGIPLARMSNHEDWFEASVLEVVAPQPSLEFPVNYHGDQAADWIARLRGPSGDRKVAFFGTPNNELGSVRILMVQYR